MKMTASDLQDMGIVEKVFAEPEVYTVGTMSLVTNKLQPAIESFLAEYIEIDSNELVERRYDRFRKM